MSLCALVLEAGSNEDEAIAALLHDAVEDQGSMALLRVFSLLILRQCLRRLLLRGRRGSHVVLGGNLNGKRQTEKDDENVSCHFHGLSLRRFTPNIRHLRLRCRRPRRRLSYLRPRLLLLRLGQ